MADYLKGRGSQIQLNNKYQLLYHDRNENQDTPENDPIIQTQIFIETPKNIISKNESPDIPFRYSINPYQGCEHGCVYCYARNSHEYWGFNAGLDFETKIIAKPDAPELLRKKFMSKGWEPELIVLSGNTDCYQPIEKKLKITRELLKVFLEFGNPAGIITKNVLVLRDMDLLGKLAAEKLVRVIFSITSLNEPLRRILEPRSANAWKKLEVIKKLTARNIPVNVMIGPVIPGINNMEIPEIIRKSYDSGAWDIHMVLVRLNGPIGLIFRDWLNKNFPDKVDKVWNQICELHHGSVNESRWGYRMRGEGKLAESIHQLFKTVKSHYFKNPEEFEYDYGKFRRHGMSSLFRD